MNPARKSYLLLHFAIFLWGFTAILGKLISINEINLVWHRLWITCVSLFFFPGILKAIRGFTKIRIATYLGIGIIVCLHWVAFYGSIKYSNVSVALSALATSSLFASIIEPLITRSKFNISDLLLGILVILGIYLIFMVSELYLKGILYGIAAAFLAALFSTLNKKYIGQNNSKAVTLLELGSGFVFLSVVLLFIDNSYDIEKIIPSRSDFIYLLILGLACTTLPFIISLNALRYISAFQANLAINLEPIYGIILAAIIFKENENLNGQFYVGTSIILIAVFLKPMYNWLKSKRKKALIKENLSNLQSP